VSGFSRTVIAGPPLQPDQPMRT